MSEALSRTTSQDGDAAKTAAAGMALVFAVAACVRTLYLFEISDTLLVDVLIGDGRGYDIWAMQLVSGSEELEGFFQAPFYPYFLAGIYSLVGHEPFLVRVVQAFLGALSCVLIAGAGHAFFGRRAGIAAGLLLAVYPMSFYYDGIVQKTSLAQFFGALLLFVLGRVATPSARRWLDPLALGVVLGGLCLLRENALAFAPLCFLWLLQHSPSNLRAQRCVVFALGMCVALSPSAWRNYEATGVALPTTYQFGTNLFIGNHTGAPGYYVALRPGRGNALVERQDTQDLAEAGRGRKLSGAEVSEYWTERALADIRSDVPAWLRLLVRKWALVWNADEISDTDSWPAYADESRLLATMGAIFHFGVLCPLAAWGIAATWRRYRELWLLHGILLAVSLSVTLFYVFGRYRYPLVIVLVLFAGAGLAKVCEATRWPKQRIALGVVCVLAVTAFTNWPIKTTETDPSAMTYNSIGVVLDEGDDSKKAQQLFRRAIALAPELWMAHANLAKALLREGDNEQSIAHYRKALHYHKDPVLTGELGLALLNAGNAKDALPRLLNAAKRAPSDAAFMNGLGAAHMKLGHVAKAIHRFRQAIELDPNNEDAKQNLATLVTFLKNRRASQQGSGH